LLAFIVCMCLHIPKLWNNSNEGLFGVDYTAYVIQAGEVANGQRNYSMISSIQGPAFYPSGLFIHYIPVYYLHMYTI